MENTNPKQTNELGRSKRSTHKAGKVGKGTLGGFTVKLLSEGGLYKKPTIGEPFNIGTGQGLTDIARKRLWNNRTILRGKIIKFRYQRIGTMDAPRLPVFLGFRDKRDL